MCSLVSIFKCFTEGLYGHVQGLIYITDSSIAGSMDSNKSGVDDMFWDALKEGFLAICACAVVLAFTRALRCEKPQKFVNSARGTSSANEEAVRKKKYIESSLSVCNGCAAAAAPAPVGPTRRYVNGSRATGKMSEERRGHLPPTAYKVESREVSAAAAEAVDRLFAVSLPASTSTRAQTRHDGCSSSSSSSTVAGAGANCASSSASSMSSGEVTTTFLSLLDSDQKEEAEAFLLCAIDSKTQVSEECVTNLFRRLIHAADTARARMWLERVSKVNVALVRAGYAGLVIGSADAGNATRAEFWLQRAVSEGLARDPALYSAVIGAWVKAKEPKRAGCWLARMEEEAEERSSDDDAGEPRFGPSAKDYVAVMGCCARTGYGQQVEVFFLRMIAAGLAPECFSMGTIIKQLVLTDGPTAADKWLRYARRYDLKLDTSVYQAAIAAATGGGHAEAAERYLIWQIESGSQPNLQSYKPLIAVWAKRGDAIRAERLIDLMVSNGISPDSALLGMVIHACAKAGDAQRAEQAFKRIATRTGEKPNVICYNALIDAFAKSGETALAERWLTTMSEEGVQPTVASYTSVLHAHARAGDLRAAERTLERMTESGVQANVVSYGALLQGFVKTGDVTRAEKWFNNMQAAGIEPNNVTYSTLINVCAKAHDSERAEKWLDNMQASGVPPTTVCYNCVIDACAEAGRCERAEFWLRRLCEASQEEKAKDGDRRQRGSRTNHGNLSNQPLMPTSASYTSAARAYAMVGSWTECERLLSEMEAAGIRMDGVSLTVLLTSYARARPQQRSRAEAAARRFSCQGMQIARPSLAALKWAVGAERFSQLCAELGLEGEVVRAPGGFTP